MFYTFFIEFQGFLVTASRSRCFSRFKQLRFYFTDGGGTNCVMLESTQVYTFEYQGNAPKLVHTPLTDTCYLTLMHGMHLGYGGNPYGPAGTGKTESVKALASALGRQVLVTESARACSYYSI